MTLKTFTRTRTVLEKDKDRPELELHKGAVEDSIQIHKTAGGYIAGYLVPDEMAENPIENCDGMGKFYHWEDNGKEEMLEYCKLRGFDPETQDDLGNGNKDAVEIDKYEHSGVAYSVRGEGMNCRWDTSTAWAMWAPDKCLLDELKDLKGAARRTKCIEYARQACTEINKWFSGDVYGVVVKHFNLKGEEIDEDSCWGYFGSEYATEELNSQIKWHLKESKKNEKQKTGDNNA